LQGTLQHEKDLGDGVKGWIRRNGAKVLNKGVEVGTTLGRKVMTEVISRYLGLPPSVGDADVLVVGESIMNIIRAAWGQAKVRPPPV
jgi:hypothetical protein